MNRLFQFLQTLNNVASVVFCLVCLTYLLGNHLGKASSSSANGGIISPNQKRLADQEPYLQCPTGYDWDSSRHYCFRIHRINKTLRCPKGQLNEDICLHVVRPIKRTCPPNYFNQENTCVLTKTAAKVLSCPPKYKLNHPTTLCVAYNQLAVGYICEKGSIDNGIPEETPVEAGILIKPTNVNQEDHQVEEENLDQPFKHHRRCVVRQSVHKRSRCPIGFDRNQQDCIKIRYYPCDHGEPNKDNASAQHDDTLAKRFLDIKSSSSGSPETHADLCWDKQRVTPSFDCPGDAELAGDHCIVTRYFPMVPKCSGTIINGMCVIELMEKPVWRCPLDFPSFGPSLTQEAIESTRPGAGRVLMEPGLDFWTHDSVHQGLHTLHPSYQVAPGTKEEKKALRLPLYHGRVFGQVELIGSSQQQQQSADLSKLDALKVKMKKKNIEFKQMRRDAKNPPFVSELGGYCYRIRYANYAIECPQGYRPHVMTNSCRAKFNPSYVCNHGFEETEHECVKYEYVAPVVATHHH